MLQYQPAILDDCQKSMLVVSSPLHFTIDCADLAINDPHQPRTRHFALVILAGRAIGFVFGRDCLQANISNMDDPCHRITLSRTVHAWTSKYRRLQPIFVQTSHRGFRDNKSPTGKPLPLHACGDPRSRCQLGRRSHSIFPRNGGNQRQVWGPSAPTLSMPPCPSIFSKTKSDIRKFDIASRFPQLLRCFRQAELRESARLDTDNLPRPFDNSLDKTSISLHFDTMKFSCKIVVADDAITSAARVTMRQSLIPNALGMQRRY